MDHKIVFITLVAALVLFVWGKWRYDVVAILALLVLVFWGIVPADEAFTGFAHPAVITVAAVLLISRALEVSGLVEYLGRIMNKAGKSLLVQIGALSLITAVASAFMNNVGALAILMPVAIQVARKNGYSPSKVLMPVAFASLLGGMITLVGTPPNIIIATFRADYSGEAFGMFDFAPVGLGLTVAGILFITFIGWRLLPERKGQSSGSDLFEIDNYITEVRVTSDSKIKGDTYGDLYGITENEVQLLGLVRRKKRIHMPPVDEPLKTNDILILEADTETLKEFVDKTGVKLVGNRKFRKDAKGSEDIVTREVVVMPDSPVIGRTAANLSMRTTYGINLLAAARRDKKIRRRLGHVRFTRGDVLLLQGRSVNIDDVISSLRWLPLVQRDLGIGKPRQIILALGIFMAAIATVLFGLLPVQIAFSTAAVALVLTRVLSARDLYQHIDWPVIILLGALIPVGIAFETTGGADLVTGQILALAGTWPVWLMIGLVMLVTMLLTGLINNAATVVLMAPIGLTIAESLGISADPLLMAIAVGASSAFLTPIGHQSNTLVMGPGGYKFGDYAIMGLPVSILIILVATPLILLVWPA